MKNIGLQGIFIIVLFFSTWFLLRQVDWMTTFKVEQMTDKTEEKLGDLYWDIFQKTGKEIKDPTLLKALDSLIHQVCDKNSIKRELLKIHVLDVDEVNAFALPDGHLIIYSGLISAADSQEELCGVICHEIAHIQLNHVMKKLIKEIGLSTLISITTGNNGGELIAESAKLLSSTAFDRRLEKEADIRAVDYMVNANIDPAPFADFLYKLSDVEANGNAYLSWISTHPESKERATNVVQYSMGKSDHYTIVISIDTWNIIKQKVQNNEEGNIH